MLICSACVTDAVKSVKKGGSVTLNSALTEIMHDDVILWRFGSEHILIFKINLIKNLSHNE